MTASADAIRPVILSGGAGTRLWPLSRPEHPKQFLSLTGGDSLLAETARRLSGPPFLAPLAIGGASQRFLLAEALQQAGIAPWRIVLEPAGRNTAAAVAVASLLAAAESPERLLLIAPSDHAISDPAAFHHAVLLGRAAAQSGQVVTFGIAPTGPETGYGYIRYRQDGAQDARTFVHSIERFVEKPTSARAEAMLAEGGHVWNSGLFLFRADIMLAELERFAPDILQACRAALAQASADPDFLRLEEQAFLQCPAIAIDVAVLEKTARASVLPVSMGWSDVGSWAALWEIAAKDDAGNAQIGAVIAKNCRDCYLRSADGKTLAAVGLEGMAVIATDDAVLVVRLDRAQDVKHIPEMLARSPPLKQGIGAYWPMISQEPSGL